MVRTLASSDRLLGVGLIGAATLGFFLFSSQKRTVSSPTQFTISIPKISSRRPESQGQGAVVPVAQSAPAILPLSSPKSTPSAQKEAGQTQEGAQAVVKPLNEQPLINAGIDLGLAALSTQSVVPRVAENFLAKKALRQGIGLVPLAGLPAGIALDMRNGRSAPLAVVANVAGDIFGVVGGAVGAPLGGIGGVVLGAGAQIGVQEGIYYFANQAGFT